MKSTVCCREWRTDTRGRLFVWTTCCTCRRWQALRNTSFLRGVCSLKMKMFLLYWLYFSYSLSWLCLTDMIDEQKKKEDIFGSRMCTKLVFPSFHWFIFLSFYTFSRRLISFFCKFSITFWSPLALTEKVCCISDAEAWKWTRLIPKGAGHWRY